MDDINVLVPDRWGGVDVCSVLDLASRIADDDPDPALNAAFDSGTDLVAMVRRVRALNETGDVDAYWRTD